MDGQISGVDEVGHMVAAVHKPQTDLPTFTYQIRSLQELS